MIACGSLFIKMKIIRKGFVDKKYHGLACIVQQPNGNYLLITHSIDEIYHHPNLVNNFIKFEYVGDFVYDKFFTTLDYVTDPNIQAKQKQNWQSFY